MGTRDRQPADRHATLKTSAINLIKAYRAAAKQSERTATLKRLAVVIVDFRSLHTLSDGRPDWSGRSSEYREAIAQIYREGGIPDEDLDTFQAALRYHVGNRLREVAPTAELQDAGLGESSPRERLHASRSLVEYVRQNVKDVNVDAGVAVAFAAVAEATVMPGRGPSPLDSLLIAERILREVRMTDVPEDEITLARDAVRRCARRCLELL